VTDGAEYRRKLFTKLLFTETFSFTLHSFGVADRILFFTATNPSLGVDGRLPDMF
jgi:hypothetical protein